MENHSTPSKEKNFSVKQGMTLFTLTFIVLLFHQLIDQILNSQMVDAMRRETSLFAFIAFGIFINSLLLTWIYPPLLLYFFQKFHPETKAIPFSTKLSDYTREWLRGMGDASLWMFVFIIPGLLRWIEYTLLPFICFFDSSYQRGEQDALKLCRSIIRGHRLRLWLLWLGFSLVIPLLLTGLFSQYESLFKHPIAGSALVFAEAFFQLLGFWLLWKFYLYVINKSIKPL